MGKIVTLQEAMESGVSLWLFFVHCPSGVQLMVYDTQSPEGEPLYLGKMLEPHLETLDKIAYDENYSKSLYGVPLMSYADVLCLMESGEVPPGFGIEP